jgi:hypothetical protein
MTKKKRGKKTPQKDLKAGVQEAGKVRGEEAERLRQGGSPESKKKKRK